MNDKTVTYQVVETFDSINGEGMSAGELAHFIRFKGCNLDCSYCDTRWANHKDIDCVEESVETILSRVLDSGIKKVTLTGGEPLLQRDLEVLIHAMINEGLDVEVETNGSVSLEKWKQSDLMTSASGKLSFTMDYKLTGSGMVASMVKGNAGLLEPTDAIKYVCSSSEDLEEAICHMKECGLVGRTNVLLSAVFGGISHETIVKRMLEEQLNGVRLQLQMHKYIWHPEARGV